jgi:hypothetical protein
MALKCHCENRRNQLILPLAERYGGKSTPELIPRRKKRRKLSEESTFGQKIARATAVTKRMIREWPYISGLSMRILGLHH